MADPRLTPKSLKAKSTASGWLRNLAFLAISLAIPAILAGQESAVTLAKVDFAAVNMPSVSELPTAPDVAVAPTTSQPLTPAAAFAIRAVEITPRQSLKPHRFWDRQNSTLAAASVAWATADFFVTRSNLSSGGRELDPITRAFGGSTAGLAANFALETGSVLGVSYFFHKTGHHKLERMTSYVNISASAGAVVYGLTHR